MSHTVEEGPAPSFEVVSPLPLAAPATLRSFLLLDHKLPYCLEMPQAFLGHNHDISLVVDRDIGSAGRHID